jgi:uncharacterized glyoxalase superfamily protein PhnB
VAGERRARLSVAEHEARCLGASAPLGRPASTVSIYAVIPDPDAQYARSHAAAAKIVRELEDMPYGSREFSVRDPEGNLWSFGTYDPYQVP